MTHTEEFRGHSSRGPTAWVFVEGRDNFPSSAIEAGRDKDNHPIYIARASQGSSLRMFCLALLLHLFDVPFFILCLEIGKASPVFREGSAIGYAGKVIEVTAHFHSPTAPYPETQSGFSSASSRFLSAIPARYDGSRTATS